MATVSGSITDLLRDAQAQRWTIHPNDVKALQAFDKVARNVYKSPPADLDYLIDELKGGNGVRDAVAAACKLLGWDMSGIKSPDLVAHIIGCPIVIIERKRINRIRGQQTYKGLTQVTTLFRMYSELHERGLTHQWLSKNTKILRKGKHQFDESDFDKFGGFAVVHIDRIQSDFKNRLLHNIMVSKKPGRMAGRVVLQRRPYTLIVERLKKELSSQVTLT